MTPEQIEQVLAEHEELWIGGKSARCGCGAVVGEDREHPLTQTIEDAHRAHVAQVLASLMPQATETVDSDFERDRAAGHDDVIGVLCAAARHPHKGPVDTDASMLREAAKRLRGGYEPGGSWTKQTVAKVIETVAALIEDAPGRGRVGGRR